MIEKRKQVFTRSELALLTGREDLVSLVMNGVFLANAASYLLQQSANVTDLREPTKPKKEKNT
jgi:hypothetical protein